MPCKIHEVFFRDCGHIFRCEVPHESTAAHPCNHYLHRTISPAWQSCIGSSRMCGHCQGGAQLPDHFEFQKFSDELEYWDWDWSRELQERREYYEREILTEEMVERALKTFLGNRWDEAGGNRYVWEDAAGRERSCRERADFVSTKAVRTKRKP